MAKAKKTENKEKLLKVTLVYGTNGCVEKQKKTVEALGLTKIRSFKIVKDNEAVRGMLAVIAHLVKVEPAEAAAE